MQPMINKYETFKELLLNTKAASKEDFFKELEASYLIDKNLLERYWITFVKEKEVQNASKQQQSVESTAVETV